MNNPAEDEVSRALASRDLPVDPALAAAIAPALRSLRERLARLRQALSDGAEPPASGVKPPRA